MLVHECVTGEFRTRAGHARGVVILLEEWVAHAQDSTKFRSGHARVGGQAVVVVEARFRRPGREIGATKIGEALLEACDDFSCAGVARGNGTTSTGIAALEIHCANAESNGAAFFFARELISA